MAIQLEVNINNVTLNHQDVINKGEYNVNECEFTFTNEFTNLEKRAVFTNIRGESYLAEIVDNKCIIPSKILGLSGEVVLGVYGYENEDNELKLRYSPEPCVIEIKQGSYVENPVDAQPAKSVKDLIDEYNENAINKTNEFNQNVINKISTFDNHFNDKVDEFNRDFLIKINEFNEDYEEKVNEFDANVIEKTNEFNDNAIQKTNEFNDNADNRTDELNEIAEGIEDMTTAIQFATFMIDDDMHLYIIQADRLKNTNFLFDEETGRLGVKIV